MKVCPECNNEYDNDMEVCPEDNAPLMTVDAEDAVGTEDSDTVEAAALSDVDETNLDAETADLTSDESVEEINATEQDSESADMADEFETAPEMENATAAKAKAASSGGGGSALPKILLLVGIMIAVGAGLVYWKNKVGGHDTDYNKVSKHEMELLLKDFNPMQLKQLGENPEQKKQLVDNISELLAIASQARKEGFADQPAIKKELASLDKSLYAINYDRKINADKGPMPPFGYISEDQVTKYYEGGKHDAEFKEFIDTKLELARKSGQIAKDQEPSEEELKQAKDAFAKTQIYYEEAMNKLDNLGTLPEAEQKEWKEWKEKTDLQIKLQKAQFLTQNYVQDVLTKKFEVTEEDIKKYEAEHPELTNDGDKKKKAEEILKKVKDGGDFAELAKEFSEDPGSKDKGGLYEGISKGQFAPEFEAAAFALEPGQVANEVVKTSFGYHIIKLEKKGEAKGANGEVTPTFDARHILISTMVKDPDNPAAREMPADQFIKSKLEKEKQEKILAEIKKNNPVEVASDFEIPKVSDEEMQKMQEEQMKRMQQMQGPQGGPQAPPSPPPPAEDAKEAPKAEKKADEKK